ncbi:MAG TPA: ParA family protein [Thermoanaerobaculia bacterium]|nr:ParA family protein [Thermoanaerobaculia bacterium]
MIVAIVSKKGGVGKTTTAVSLGAALASQGRRVLLVDLDPQASTSLWMGVRRADLAPSVADVMLNGTSLSEAIRPTATRGLELLTASADLAQCERELMARRDRDVVLRERLRAGIQARYDYVFIDSPAGLSLLTMNALVASDAFLVPATPDFLALEGLDNLLQATERIAFRNRVHLPCLGIVLTKVDQRTRLSRETAAQIRTQHGNRVFTTEIHGNVRIAEAPAYSKTIFEYDGQSRSASDYRLLAVEVDLRRERHQPKAAAPATSLERAPSAVPPALEQKPQVAAMTRPAEPTAVEAGRERRPAEDERTSERRSSRPIWLKGLGGLAG